MSLDAKLISTLQTIVGDNGYAVDSNDKAAHENDWRGRVRGNTPVVLFPKTTEQVSKLVKLCHDNDIKITPQGGNTGLVLGGIPSVTGDEIVINLKRMNKIINIDSEAYTITCEAGCILQTVQELASDNNRLFPVSLAAEGSCFIGGNIATNAGGIHVLRYGNMREQVLGLEVVLPNGEVWNGLKALRKDNSGYDLKQMFIGSEGTLGIITKATLKLAPKPTSIETAMLGVENVEDAIKLLAELRAQLGDGLVAFEIFPHDGLEIVLKNINGTKNPMNQASPWYAICEMWGFEEQQVLSDRFTQTLANMCEEGLAGDVVLASSNQQRKDFWDLREMFAPALKMEGAGFAFDASIAVSKIPEFLATASPAIEKVLPNVRVIPFGHAGDGNIHYNIAPPLNMGVEELLTYREKIVTIVHDIIQSLGGSIAAEHGVGTQKTAELARLKDPIELKLFNELKNTLDPKGIMNKGRIIN